MDKIRYGLVAILGSMGAWLSHPAIAADDTTPVMAAAAIDWSHLQLSVTGVNGAEPTVSYTSQNTSLSSYAASSGQNENNSKSINNWTDTAETNADAGTTYASTVASPLSFSGNAVSMENGYTTASGGRTVNFHVDGPGVLTVTVPYTISLTGDTTGCYYCYNYDHASVSGHANFYSYADHGSSSSDSQASFSLDNYYWNHSPQSQSGTLVFGVFASGAGDGSLQLNFDLATQGASMVPEPESYAMLLAGLALLGTIVKRRSMDRNSLQSI